MQTMTGMAQQQGIQNSYKYNFPHPTDLTTDELRTIVTTYQKVIDQRELHTPQPGPTVHEMNTHEALKNAYNEYKTVRKLLGL